MGALGEVDKLAQETRFCEKGLDQWVLTVKGGPSRACEIENKQVARSCLGGAKKLFNCAVVHRSFTRWHQHGFRWEAIFCLQTVDPMSNLREDVKNAFFGERRVVKNHHRKFCGSRLKIQGAKKNVRTGM